MKMPLSVRKACGPPSVTALSIPPGRMGSTVRCSPLASSSTFQSVRLSDVASISPVSLKYIQYFPLILCAINRDPSRRQTIAPDFDQKLRYFPLWQVPMANPCLVHLYKSLETAQHNRANSPSQ